MANVKVLVVGGGGHGGKGDFNNNGGGGGGGGGYQYNASFAVTEKVYEVKVGGPGDSSVFDTITAIGGGNGGDANGSGSNGACGGGAGGRQSTSYAGLGGTGSNGGNGGNAEVPTSTSENGGAGGGGNSANGGNGKAYYGGNGGAGILNSISGTATYYCGGGGGGGIFPGSGGIGGGGDGDGNYGYPGTPNTGGGGGGSLHGGISQGGSGGSGIVIVRFTTTDFPSAAVSGTGNTLIEDGSEKVATFITSGKLGLGGLTTIPTVTTQSATDVATTSFTGNGNITDTGGENCTRRGFCYKAGTSGDPTTSDSVAYDDGSFGTGAFTKSITGLTPNTSYRVRAYAVNSAGTSYGTTVQVTTLKAFKPRTMWF